MSRPEHTPEQAVAPKKKHSFSTIFIVVALILIAILIMTFPGVDADASLSERLEVIFGIELGSEDENDFVMPTPDPALFTEPQSETDAAFLELLEAFISIDAEASFDELMVLHEEYLPQFEPYATADIVDPDLQFAAKSMVSLLKAWQECIYTNDDGDIEGIEDWRKWSQSRVDLCNLVLEVNAKYNLLPETKYIPQQYSYILPIWEAQLEVQNDLHAQLSKPKKVWSAEEDCYYITYTNNTLFDMDVTIYGDYISAERGYIYDKLHTDGLKPGESVTLYMKHMPDDVREWVADWVVDTYYVDGIDIYEYY